MNVNISQQFMRESVAKIGVKADTAIEALKTPDQREIISVDGTQFAFYTRKIPHARNGAAILVYGRLNAVGDLELLRGFKFYPDLAPAAQLQSPSNALRALAEKFGFPVTINGKRAHFFLNDVVEQKKTPAIGKDVVKVEELASDQIFSLEMMMKADELPNAIRCRVGLAYCIDVDRYVAWTKSQS
jgi:hypothetical protein